MEKQDGKRGRVTRREFLGTTAAAAALSTVPFHIRCASSNRSNFGGVQIGTITYSFRGLSGLEETLQACIDSGVGGIELMGSGVETYLGAPELVRVPRQRQAPPAGMGAMPGGAAPGGAPPAGMPQGFPGMGQQQQTLSEEELAELQKQAEASQAALIEWRQTVGTPEKYAEVRKMFNDAGIDIHIYKWTAGNSEEELDYSFKVAKALGAVGITLETPNSVDDETFKLIGPVAEQNGMYAILHNHMQYAQEGFTIDPYLEYSPAVMLNFDAGHYFGSTGLNPCDFVEKHHDRMISIHLKDKTGPDVDPPNQNQVWGQGQVPLTELLLLVKNKYPKIYGDIELEYPVPAWSNSVKEVKNCVNFCRQILI
ncbi:sugar phosphate isomerase/epimerase [bacterium]|nr:sugar phosphate isomerase/epimerase [bacterium]RQV97813.1 MAG: sugar phosphate isomerase/epimerase [bacterium]